MTQSKFAWDEIQLFVAIAQEGSFARAAARLKTTQPTITRRVQVLEDNLGEALFRRTTSGVELTDMARSILDAAEQMQRSAASVDRILNKSNTSEGGHVSIRAPDGLAAYWIVPHLPHLFDAYPELQVTLDCGLWRQTGSDPQVDLCLSIEEPEDLDLIRVPVGWLHYCAFGARSYVQRFGAPETLTDVFRHRTIRHLGQRHQREYWQEITSALETLSNDQLITNSSAASFQATRMGLGLSIGPTLMCSVDKDLVPLPFGELASARLYLVYSRESVSSPIVKAVRDWLIELFEPRRIPWTREEFVDPCEAMHQDAA